MGQRLSNATRTPRARAIKAHHRGALRQSITLINRQSRALGTLQQIFRNPRAADGSETQVLRIERFLFGRADQHQQQLRHQNQALRRPAGKACQPLRHIHAAGTPDAQGFLSGQTQGRTGVQRGITADVFQQDGQRQQGQVMLRIGGFARQIQLTGDLQNSLGTQAHTLWGAGSPRGECELGRSFRHAVGTTKGATPELATLLIPGCL
ncbi:hypothetical protein D3C84_772140 [compost metagenome]